MRKVVPYRTLSGAMRALDNGGRFFNMFTRAGDEVVSKAELKRVAGATAGIGGALLFFELATSELDEESRERLLAMFEPKLRRRYRSDRPLSISPARFATDAVPAKSCIVTGWATGLPQAHTEQGFIYMPIMVGNVTTMSVMPVSKLYDVYELTGERRVRAACRIMVKKGSDVSSLGRVRWGGRVKEIEKSQDGKAGKRLLLEVSYYTPL